jgi:2'-5' RNA ligase
MRLFVALEITSSVRENLAALIDNLRAVAPQAKWVRPENLHVTLKFIGEVPDTKTAEVASILRVLCGVYQGVRSHPVNLCFRGLGFFPDDKRPRVFWLGIEASANLKGLSADIGKVTEKLGIPNERRPFSPHLTLARFEPPRLPEKLSVAIQESAKRDFGSLHAREFHLIESKLKSSGAEYTTLESFAFAAAEA